MPINEFRKECREFAEGWIKVQTEKFQRLEICGDFENPYTTMNFHTEAHIACELLKFTPNTDLPTVYMVDNNGKETIPVRNTVGTYNNIIKLHNTSRKWILRSGKRVLAIYNGVYNPNAYVPGSGTIFPTVQRHVLKR